MLFDVKYLPRTDVVFFGFDSLDMKKTPVHPVAEAGAGKNDRADDRKEQRRAYLGMSE